MDNGLEHVMCFYHPWSEEKDIQDLVLIDICFIRYSMRAEFNRQIKLSNVIVIIIIFSNITIKTPFSPLWVQLLILM